MAPTATLSDPTDLPPATTDTAGPSTCDPRQAVAGLVGQVRDVLEGIDPDEVLARHAPGVWDLLDEGAKLFTGAQTLLARRVADSGVHKDAGTKTTAEYLALRSGVSNQAAAEMLATSSHLRALPTTETALRAGRLSVAQAHRVSNAAIHNPARERHLLDVARQASLKELRDAALRARHEADPDPEATRQRHHRDRCFRQGNTADGGWWFSGRGKPEDAGRFNAALNPLIENIFRQARDEGRHEPRDAYAYDALLAMARRAHHNPTATRRPTEDSTAQHPAGETGTTKDNGSPEPPGNRAGGTAADGHDNIDQHADIGGRGEPGHRSGHTSRDPHRTPTDDPARSEARPDEPGTGNVQPPGPHTEPVSETPPAAGRHQPKQSLLPVLRLDLAALHRGHLAASELCEITSIGPVSLDAARELLDEAIVKLVLTNAGRAVTVTHIGRTPPQPTHLAILHADMTTLSARETEVSPSLPEKPSPKPGAIEAATAHDPLPSEKTCTIPGLGPIPEQVARGLLGQLAGRDLLGQVLTRGRDVAALVHPGRQPTTAQRVALLWAQPTCSVAGCPHTFTQIDHRHDWHKNHVTELDNLDRLCPAHHKLKTHGNFQLVPGTGDRAFVPPTDARCQEPA